jgi:3-hydroxyacyl-[acyl-carrier-protein] dehydratase
MTSKVKGTNPNGNHLPQTRNTPSAALPQLDSSAHLPTRKLTTRPIGRALLHRAFILNLAMSNVPPDPTPDAASHTPPHQTTDQQPAAPTTMDILEIMALLPHRYPFLLIDRVVEMVPRQRLVAIKNITINEPQFQGHFPDYPIMPGVLMVEAIAQAGGALLLSEVPDRESKLLLFTSIENARFRRPVTPGDQLRIEVTVINWRSRAVKMGGSITVDGKLVCDAVVMCQVVPRVAKVQAKVEAKVETAE